MLSRPKLSIDVQTTSRQRLEWRVYISDCSRALILEMLQSGETEVYFKMLPKQNAAFAIMTCMPSELPAASRSRHEFI